MKANRNYMMFVQQERLVLNSFSALYILRVALFENIIFSAKLSSLFAFMPVNAYK